MLRVFVLGLAALAIPLFVFAFTLVWVGAPIVALVQTAGGGIALAIIGGWLAFFWLSSVALDLIGDWLSERP